MEHSETAGRKHKLIKDRVWKQNAGGNNVCHTEIVKQLAYRRKVYMVSSGVPSD